MSDERRRPQQTVIGSADKVEPASLLNHSPTNRLGATASASTRRELWSAGETDDRPQIDSLPSSNELNPILGPTRALIDFGLRRFGALVTSADSRRRGRRQPAGRDRRWGGWNKGQGYASSVSSLLFFLSALETDRSVNY